MSGGRPGRSKVSAKALPSPARTPFFSLLVAVASICAALASPRPAEAELPDTPNPSTWVTDDYRVSAIARAGGLIYIGGSFFYVGPNNGCGAPIDRATGALAPVYPKVDDWVEAVAPDGAGGWYIGGRFDKVGALTRRGIAHILSDGTVDPLWDAAASGPVDVIAANGSTVYVAGSFTSIGGASRRRIAALDVVTGAATDWNPDAYWSSDSISSIAVGGPSVYVGGSFEKMGGLPQKNVAEFDAPVLLGRADYDADNREEIGVFRNGMLWFLSYSPDWTAVDLSKAFGSPVPRVDKPELGEVNCLASGGGKPDGQTDLAIFRAPTSTWQAALSPGWNGVALSVAFGTTAHKRIPLRRLDTNGDGCSDIGVFKNGCFDVLGSPGYTTVGTHVCFGLGTDEPLAADLDGDDKSDLVLWRASSARHTYRLSSEGYGIDHGANLGAGDYALVGDLNGDGRADLGSYKQAFSTFRFTYSPDFAGVDLVKTHGSSGDIPILADMNGDGIDDIGIFRDAIARWLFLCSPSWSDSCVSLSFGRSGDLPIYGKPIGMP